MLSSGQNVPNCKSLRVLGAMATRILSNLPLNHKPHFSYSFDATCINVILIKTGRPALETLLFESKNDDENDERTNNRRTTEAVEHLVMCVSLKQSTYVVEPPHDKTNKVSVRPAKTKISLDIRPVRSESSLSA